MLEPSNHNVSDREFTQADRHKRKWESYRREHSHTTLEFPIEEYTFIYQAKSVLVGQQHSLFIEYVLETYFARFFARVQQVRLFTTIKRIICVSHKLYVCQNLAKSD